MNNPNNDTTFEQSNSWKYRNSDMEFSDIPKVKRNSKFPTPSWIGMLHGLDYLGSLKSYPKKCVWVFFLIITIAISLYLIVYTMEEIIENKTMTLFKIKNVPWIKYHGITLCPKYSDGYNVSKIKKKLLTIDRFLTNDDLNKFLIYLSAGGGFDNYDKILKELNNKSLLNFEIILLRIVKSFGSLEKLYSFVFEEQNISCNDFFENCFFGNRGKNCCEMFEETFVLIRGKCFKMKDFYQISPDEMDKISLIIKPIGSTFIGNSRFQEQVVVYSNERKKYVPFFPRFYIYGNNQNILKFNKYVYYLLNNNNQCNPNRNYEGLSLCYIDYWLKTKLHDPYNCTLFYMGYKKWKMCDPIIILKNYEKIMSVALDNVKCLQACKYEEIRTEFFSKHLNYKLNGTKNKKDYRIRVEFSYLKMTNYVYKEVSKLTISGYISELGGYTGLFIDLNIISLLLAAFIMIKYIYKKFLKIKIDRRIGIGI